MNESEARPLIVELCRRLHARNLLAACDGNLSVRLDDGRLLVTPSGVNKAFLEASRITILSNGVEGGMPSSELKLHLEVYRRCPAARAVVHAHPPTAVAWSLARPHLRELPSEGLPEVTLAVGRVPISPYARPGTEAMAEAIRPFLPKHRVMILARHGALSWGEDPVEAYNGIERLEHAATMLKLAAELGGSKALPEGELRELRKLRERLGERTL